MNLTMKGNVERHSSDCVRRQNHICQVPVCAYMYIVISIRWTVLAIREAEAESAHRCPDHDVMIWCHRRCLFLGGG